MGKRRANRPSGLTLPCNGRMTSGAPLRTNVSLHASDTLICQCPDSPRLGSQTGLELKTRYLRETLLPTSISNPLFRLRTPWRTATRTRNTTDEVVRVGPAGYH